MAHRGLFRLPPVLGVYGFLLVSIEAVHAGLTARTPDALHNSWENSDACGRVTAIRQSDSELSVTKKCAGASAGAFGMFPLDLSATTRSSRVLNTSGPADGKARPYCFRERCESAASGSATLALNRRIQVRLGRSHIASCSASTSPLGGESTMANTHKKPSRTRLWCTHPYLRLAHDGSRRRMRRMAGNHTCSGRILSIAFLEVFTGCTPIARIWHASSARG